MVGIPLKNFTVKFDSPQLLYVLQVFIWHSTVNLRCIRVQSEDIPIELKIEDLFSLCLYLSMIHTSDVLCNITFNGQNLFDLLPYLETTAGIY